MKKLFSKECGAQISFPLGGIGTGSVGLAGNGALVDWEIRNRPNRESINGFSNFAIKAEDEAAQSVVDARLLQGDTMRDYMGGLHFGNHSWGFGHGPNRGTMAGEKHFENVEFCGEFPIATVRFRDVHFPGEVSLEAFNPFIPGNSDDSSIPAAFFQFSIQNPTERALKYSIGFSVTNPFPKSGRHAYVSRGGVSAITMDSGVQDPDGVDYGQAAIAADGAEMTWQEYWYRGGWFDEVTMFNNEFFAYGPMKNRRFDSLAEERPDTSTLAASISVEPGEKRSIRFLLTWCVPNCWKYWSGAGPETAPKWKNYCARRFPNPVETAEYCFQNWERLHGDTVRFKEALFSSSLPECVLDAIQGNLATLKSSTCLRLEDGTFYGFEGVGRDYGSCEGTCQHVWNYAYVLPFLFPDLERSIRETELTYDMEPSGELHFRTMLPLGSGRQDFRACVDGQMGTVMKFYREWKICGDNRWLERYWGRVKKCIEYAWSPDNGDRWDPDKTGVIHGRQYHTLDMELFGANSWLTGFYHGALLAGAEMAEAMGENETAAEYRSLFQKGRQWLDAHTFNGRHYVQNIDIRDRALLEKYGGSANDAVKNYWDGETGEIKYQIGEGCEIDQVVAGWHADLMGLPPVFDPDHRRQALESIYQVNFKSMREVQNPCRIFACDGEKGVLMCAWEDGTEKPKITIPYTEECMSGFEYAAACNMLQCGMEKEALEIVAAIRERYDGKKRNPWAEIECGASYARAMASYSLLLAYSGFRYDLTEGRIGFQPVRLGRYFWAIEGAWGTVELEERSVSLKVCYGRLALRRVETGLEGVSEAELDGKRLEFRQEGSQIVLDAVLEENSLLTLK